MRLILNEKEVLKNSLENGYVDNKKPTNTIKLLAKHYLSINMNKKQAIYSINDFFTKYYKGYNSVQWIDTIEKIVKSIHKSKDYELFVVDKIEITNNELETIKKINNGRLEKLAFTLLVYAKIYNKLNKNNTNWINEEHKYIFSDAKVVVKIEEQGKMIHKLGELGLVEVSRKVDCTNIKINFADENSDVGIEITDFRDFVYLYLKWKGENIGFCEECNVPIRITNGNLKYCKSCAKKMQRAWDREYQRKKYNSRVADNSSIHTTTID